MANIKSQKKRIRTNEAAHLRNKEVKSAIKTSIRSVHKAINDGDKDSAETAFAVAARRLDKAAGRGVIHRNQAANRKSGLATAINAM
ncbi:30S ribosomal protein S20 [Bombiscardovia apis]|uniref:Small ribosomal subunit protein bS20 n=1 Tax=Bombiscardovia apis TaxID=2932182 RepID=A0ABM8BCT3_9BIFI|nr:30S ribosomal protein S20 [Bombiscardovia apis]BDR54729.1 30S ribosomal protein S20 [Bombiscardovia apis]